MEVSVAFCDSPLYVIDASRQRYLGRKGISSSRAPRVSIIYVAKCSALEDSKKRARSPYDNIPDLHQQYLRELQRAKAEYGPGFPKDIYAEAATPILRPDGVRARATPMTVDANAIAASREKSLLHYQKLRSKLFSDTVFLGALEVSAGWAFGDVHTALSVALGVCGSIAYVVLLARGVDSMSGKGDFLAPARLAVLALLVVGAAKHRELFQVVPVMLGFLTFKIATVLPLITGEAFDDEIA